MPISRSKTVASTSTNKNEQSVSEVLNSFNFDDENLFKFSNDELDTWISELQTASTARTPEEIDEINSSRFNSALKAAQFAKTNSDKAVLSNDDIKEKEKIDVGLTAENVKLAVQASVVFAFVHGNVTNKKCWIRLTHKATDSQSLYVSFPLLNAVGSRSTLVHVYRNEISKFLDDGKKNTLVSILEKSNITVKKNKLKYLFPKGHLLSQKKEEIEKIRKDLNHIFEEMKKPVEKRAFKLEWFNV